MTMEELIGEAIERNESLDPRVLRNSLQMAVRFAEQGDEHAPFHGLLFIVGDQSCVQAKGQCDQRHLENLEGTIKDACDNPGVTKRLKMACKEDGAVVVNGSTGKLVCGAFMVHDLSHAANDGAGGARHMAASSIAQLTQSVAIVVSQSYCGSTDAPPRHGVLQVYAGSNERKALRFGDISPVSCSLQIQAIGDNPASAHSMEASLLASRASRRTSLSRCARCLWRDCGRHILTRLLVGVFLAICATVLFSMVRLHVSLSPQASSAPLAAPVRPPSAYLRPALPPPNGALPPAPSPPPPLPPSPTLGPAPSPTSLPPSPASPPSPISAPAPAPTSPPPSPASPHPPLPPLPRVHPRPATEPGMIVAIGSSHWTFSVVDHEKKGPGWTAWAGAVPNGTTATSLINSTQVTSDRLSIQFQEGAFNTPLTAFYWRFTFECDGQYISHAQVAYDLSATTVALNQRLDIEVFAFGARNCGSKLSPLACLEMKMRLCSTGNIHKTYKECTVTMVGDGDMQFHKCETGVYVCGLFECSAANGD